MSDIPLGRPCWYELMTTDPDAAPDFYGQIAGWGTAPFEGGPMPYNMWMNGETPIGGYMQLPEEAQAAGAPSHWLVHISTPNIEETATKATELGGTVMTRMEVPTVGEFAIIQDPQGAVFSAFQPATEAPGHDGAPELGEFSWNELMTESWEAAWDFYSELFGWQKEDAMDMGEAGTYQMWGRGAHPMGGFMNRPPEMPMSAWAFYVRVQDADTAVEKVKELGGSVMVEPMDVPGGDRVAMCTDPTGAAFAVHSVGTAQA